MKFNINNMLMTPLDVNLVFYFNTYIVHLNRVSTTYFCYFKPINQI